MVATYIYIIYIAVSLLTMSKEIFWWHTVSPRCEDALRKNKSLILQRMNYRRRGHGAQRPLLHPQLWGLQTAECLQHQKEHSSRAKQLSARGPCTSCPISAPSLGRNRNSGDLVAKVRDSGDLVAKVASESCESEQELWRSLNWVPGTAQGLTNLFKF